MGARFADGIHRAPLLAFLAFDTLVLATIGVDVVRLVLMGFSFKFTTKLPRRCAQPFSVMRKSCIPKVPSPAA